MATGGRTSGSSKLSSNGREIDTGTGTRTNDSDIWTSNKSVAQAIITEAAKRAELRCKMQSLERERQLAREVEEAK